MTDYLVRSAGWNAVVTAEHPAHAVDLAVADAPDTSKAGLGLVIQVIDLDACAETADYVDTATILARLGYRDVETVGGLVLPADAVLKGAE